MTLFKSTFASAAVAALCLGSMPAAAQSLAQQNYDDIDRAIENTFTAVDNGDYGTACASPLCSRVDAQQPQRLAGHEA